jgi:hypothetical protein
VRRLAEHSGAAAADIGSVDHDVRTAEQTGTMLDELVPTFCARRNWCRR